MHPLMLALALAAAGQPVPIILDTDMGGDCDDAGALAVLHVLANRGQARLLAVTSCTSAHYTPGCIDAINAWYGRPETPVGALKEEGFMAKMDEKYCRAVATELPNRLRNRDNALDATQLLRRTLAGRPDGGIALVAVGPLRNIRLLLQSKPDEASPLDGRALAKAKVRQLVVMGGFFGAKKPFEQAGEWNFAQDPASAATVANEWPTPVLYSGFEIGNSCPTGARLSTETPENNPVRRSYEQWHGRPGQNRPSWDLTAALAAVTGPAPWWDLGPAGRCIVDPANGANRWEAVPGGKDHYLVERMPPADVARALDDLLVLPPMQR